MSTANKDFKIKNGIQVNEGGFFGGPVAVGTPTNPDHAITKEYLELVLSSFEPETIDGGTPTTSTWGNIYDGGPL